MEDEATCIVLNLISYDLARRLIDAAIAEARGRGIALSFVVLDSAGHLVASARMDGAPFVTIEIARGKAFASVATGGHPGGDLEQRYRDTPQIWGNVSALGYGAPMLPAKGSLPLRLDGRLIGAIGASGAPSHIDEEVISIAAAAIGANK